MAYDPATLPATYAHVALEKLDNMGNLGTHPVALHEVDREQIIGIRGEIGTTPAVTDVMGYVRLSDAAGHGLWVPAAALGPGLVINGNCDVWQRPTGPVTATTTFNTMTSFGPDRMFVLPAGASVTHQRSTTVPDARSLYSWQINGAGSVTTVDIGQRIRSGLVNTRGRQSLVFSAYVYNGSGAAFSPGLRVGTPGAVDNFGTVTNRLNQPLGSCADAAWTRVYHVFDPSAYTNVANGMEVCLRVPSGSLVASDVVRVAQFDLRPGIQIGGYLPPDLDQELTRCLPYWETLGLAPSGSNTHFAQGESRSSTIALMNVFYTQKRNTPALAYSAVGHFQVDDGGANETTVLALDNCHLSGGRLVATVASGLTTGAVAFLRADGTVDARLYLDAELT